VGARHPGEKIFRRQRARAPGGGGKGGRGPGGALTESANGRPQKEEGFGPRVPRGGAAGVKPGRKKPKLAQEYEAGKTQFAGNGSVGSRGTAMDRTGGSSENRGFPPFIRSGGFWRQIAGQVSAGVFSYGLNRAQTGGTAFWGFRPSMSPKAPLRADPDFGTNRRQFNLDKTRGPKNPWGGGVGGTGGHLVFKGRKFTPAKLAGAFRGRQNVGGAKGRFFGGPRIPRLQGNPKGALFNTNPACSVTVTTKVGGLDSHESSDRR